ncbi:MAG: hypothetical protein WKF96_10060 [Solirubrobacteraceae bacterium]
MNATALHCTQDGCPIATEGRCLEGFGNGTGEGCPHLRALDDPALDIEERQVAESEPTDDTEEQNPAHLERFAMIGLGGTESLTMAEADHLAADGGAHVVVVAGEEDSGKTTLVTELWAQFLLGSFCGWLFAGSRTLLAFDLRHRGARASSGEPRPGTPRTQEEDFRLMHLRLVENDSQRPITLLLSDAKGELYENVINGTPVADELDAVARGDFLLILVDGAEVEDDLKRSVALHRARLLLGGLLDRDGFVHGRPVALVLSRADLARPAARRWWRNQAQQLQRLSEDHGCPTIVIEVAARPDADPDNPVGLDGLLRWLTNAQPSPPADWRPDWDATARGSWRYTSRSAR